MRKAKTSGSGRYDAKPLLVVLHSERITLSGSDRYSSQRAMMSLSFAPKEVQLSRRIMPQTVAEGGKRVSNREKCAGEGMEKM